MNETKWYDKIDYQAIADHPLTWYFVSLISIGIGVWLFNDAKPDNKYQAAFSTMFISLGTAGIIRVRTAPKRDKLE